MTHDIADDEKLFLKYVRDLNPLQIGYLHEYIQNIRMSLYALMDFSARMKMIVASCLLISSSLAVADVEDTIIEEMCKNVS